MLAKGGDLVDVVGRTPAEEMGQVSGNRHRRRQVLALEGENVRLCYFLKRSRTRATVYDSLKGPPIIF